MLLLTSVVAFSQSKKGQKKAQPPPTDTVAPNIPGVVAGGTAVKVIKDGFQSTEGPVALPDGSMIFAEGRTNSVIKIDANDNVSTYVENTGGSNSLAIDGKGRLIGVQINPGETGIAVIHPAGSKAILAGNFEGKPFGRPNDLVVDKKGGIYFSDAGGQNSVPGMDPSVYYIQPDGKVVRVIEDIRPNGVQLSPDEKTLYAVHTTNEYVLAFDVQPDGTLTNRRNFAKHPEVTRNGDQVRSGADGLAVDAAGRLYVATVAGVSVYGTNGAILGTIPLSRSPQNLAFAGPDKKTLYVVGRGVAFKVSMLAEGHKGRAK